MSKSSSLTLNIWRDERWRWWRRDERDEDSIWISAMGKVEIAKKKKKKKSYGIDKQMSWMTMSTTINTQEDTQKWMETNQSNRRLPFGKPVSWQSRQAGCKNMPWYWWWLWWWWDSPTQLVAYWLCVSSRLTRSNAIHSHTHTHTWVNVIVAKRATSTSVMKSQIENKNG